jgi:hypothetical protein
MLEGVHLREMTNNDELVKSPKTVIPAKAGIHK